MIDQATTPTLGNITISNQPPADPGDLEFIIQLFNIPLALLRCVGIYLGLLLLFAACLWSATGISVGALAFTRRYILRRKRSGLKQEFRESIGPEPLTIGIGYYIIMFGILAFGGWRDLTYARFALLGPAVLASELIIALASVIVVGIAQIVGLVDRIREQNERRLENDRAAALKRDDDNKAAQEEDGGSDTETQKELVEV